MPGTTQTILLRPDPNEPEKERAWISPEIEAQIKTDIADAMKLIDNHVMLSQYDRQRVEHIVEYLVEMAHYAVALQQEQLGSRVGLIDKLVKVLEHCVARLAVDDDEGVIETIEAYMDSTLRNEIPIAEKVEIAGPPPLTPEQQAAFVKLATRDDILLPEQEQSFTPFVTDERRALEQARDAAIESARKLARGKGEVAQELKLAGIDEPEVVEGVMTLRARYDSARRLLYLIAAGSEFGPDEVRAMERLLEGFVPVDAPEQPDCNA